MGMFLEILPLIFSLIVGALTTTWTQKAEDLHHERMYAHKARKAARADQTKHTSKSRKFIVQSVMASLFLFPMLLTILNYIGSFEAGFAPISINVPREVLNGGLFSLLWSKETVEYVPIYGFVLMPIHVLMAQTIVGYYFGASAARR